MSAESSHPPPGTDVASLTARIARGDEAAFVSFHGVWYERCLALAARVLPAHDREARFDVAQDVMIRVAQRLPKLEDERAVAAWMARTVYTVAIDAVRRRQRAARRERAVSAPEASDGDDGVRAAERAEDLAHLRSALEELEPTDRQLVLARFRSDRSLRDLGASFGMTGNAAAGRIRRTLARLRSLLPETLEAHR